MDLNVWLWIVQGLLAALYGMAGSMKLARGVLPGPPSGLSPQMVRGIGAAELAGALALVLPIPLAFLPSLTPLAAIGLVLIQLGAIVFHIRRNEMGVIPVNIVLLALAAFVVWGRWDLLAF